MNENNVSYVLKYKSHDNPPIFIKRMFPAAHLLNEEDLECLIEEFRQYLGAVRENAVLIGEFDDDFNFQFKERHGSD